MKVLLQRTKWSRVKTVVNGESRVVQVETGLTGLVGFFREDAEIKGSRAWEAIAGKILNLRIFPDENQRMNLSLADIQGDLLLVPQFTLYADCRKGRRPGFSDSMPGDAAQELFRAFVSRLEHSWDRVYAGFFGADMDVELCNWGPVTIMLDSRDLVAYS